MFCFSHQFKIADFIVSWIAINVVDNFIRQKKTLQMFLHNKPMFHYVALRISVRMMRRQNSPISSTTPICNPNSKSWVIVASYVFGLPSPFALRRAKYLRPLTSANRWLTTIKTVVNVAFTKACQLFTSIGTILLWGFRFTPIKWVKFLTAMLTYLSNFHSHTYIISQLPVESKYCEIAAKRCSQEVMELKI